ncbi:MAG: class I SAM-dependent methyltransferase [Streptosporangiaceae bacterium]
MTADVRASGARVPSPNGPSSRKMSPGDVASGEVVRAVRDMYRRHPFPPAQRKHSYQRHAAYVRSFLAERGIEPRGRTFGDIACGTGLMMLDYAREFPETSFVGLDLSETSVGMVNQTLDGEAVTNARAYQQDIMLLDRAREFDYIVSWGTVHHLPDPAEGIAILCRALKPGGVLRLGVYGHYGNWERRVQQEILTTITADQMADDGARIEAVRVWAQGDRNFKNYYTAPPVDLTDDNWVVDEFLHVWEQHLRLTDVVSWLRAQGMQVQRMTDYYDQEIPLDVTYHSSSPVLAEKVGKLPFESQCHVIDMIVRPYWISLFAQKSSG